MIKTADTHPVDASDVAASFEILAEFERFNQKNDIFRRSWWDERIRSDKTERFYATYRQPLHSWRQADGFTQQDYALRNAAWHVSNLFTEMEQAEDRREGFSDAFTLQREPASEKMRLGAPTEAAAQVKRVARALGYGQRLAPQRWWQGEQETLAGKLRNLARKKSHGHR
jgi:epoxyqueuosine reductase